MAEKNIFSLLSKGDCTSMIKDMYPGRCEELRALLQVSTLSLLCMLTNPIWTKVRVS